VSMTNDPKRAPSLLMALEFLFYGMHLMLLEKVKSLYIFLLIILLIKLYLSS
jgi:hypothetical protein